MEQRPAVDIGHATPSGTQLTFAKFWKKWYANRFGASLQRPQLMDGKLFLSPVGLGTHFMDYNSGYVAAIRAGLRHGINVIDTAPNYGDGGAERAIGEALRLEQANIAESGRQAERSCQLNRPYWAGRMLTARGCRLVAI